MGAHWLETLSTNQSSPALISCEAEYCAVVDGALRVVGKQTSAKEGGIEVRDMSVGMAKQIKRCEVLRFTSWFRSHTQI